MEEIRINVANLTPKEYEQLLSFAEQVKEREKKRKPPEYLEKYWLVDTHNEVDEYTWENDGYDLDAFNLRNCFKTEEEAEFEAERRQVIAELANFADIHNDPIDWENEDAPKYFLGFHPSINEIEVDYVTSFIHSDIFFSSDEIAQDAIAAIGEDRLIRYYFRLN